MSKYYVYETGNGLAGVATAEKNLPLIGETDNMEEAEKMLKDYLVNQNKQRRRR